MEGPTTTGQAPSLKETGRVEAFSDGVFAIAITLLVLDLKVPDAESMPPGASLWETLLRQWPMFTAYLGSFLTILIMWASHHRLFNRIVRVDDPFLFINGMLLLFISFVPFPTALLAEHIQHPYASTAAAVYAGTFVLIAIVFNILWRYAAHRMRLLDKSTDQTFIEGVKRQYLFGPPMYFLAFVLAFVWVPASVGMCFALAVFFALTGALNRRLFVSSR